MARKTPDDLSNRSRQSRANNEKLFKSLNQQVETVTEPLFKAEERRSVPVEFYCECSNRECVERVSLPIDEYRAVHRDPNCFLVKPGHDQRDIENVVQQTPRYWVVRKHEDVR
ncbi:hypothetical protein KY386_02190 [Candidatus Parcubacteria bacterium]|nr:hypothetical protein [Candidatus Parcubacteria bacterium]